MLAAVLEGLNAPLSLHEVPTPVPQAGEGLVRLRAAALNHRDVWIQQGQYAGIRYPIILGSDGSGDLIRTLPDGSVSSEDVLINPSMDWGENERAQRAKGYKILGLPDNGTFAEYVAVPEKYIFPKPVHLTHEQAAALPLAGMTAFRALCKRAQVAAGEKVLITGIGGGVALMALQFALAIGAEVYVTSSSDHKINKAIAMGATGGANYREDNWVETLKALNPAGFDVIIDSAGGEAFGKLVEMCAPGARIAFYGGTQGSFPPLSPQKLFWKQISILGSTMGSEKDFAEMLQFVSEHRIVPVIDEVFPLSAVQYAMERMAQSQQFGKIVLTIR